MSAVLCGYMVLQCPMFVALKACMRAHRKRPHEGLAWVIDNIANTSMHLQSNSLNAQHLAWCFLHNISHVRVPWQHGSMWPPKIWAAVGQGRRPAPEKKIGLLWGRAEGPYLKKFGAAVGQGRRPAPEIILGLLWGRAEGPHLASQVAFPEPENLASIAGLANRMVFTETTPVYTDAVWYRDIKYIMPTGRVTKHEIEGVEDEHSNQKYEYHVDVQVVDEDLD